MKLCNHSTGLAGFTNVNDVPENGELPPDFHLPFCWLFCKNWLWKLKTQSLWHWRQSGHKKPLSVRSSKVTLETGFLNVGQIVPLWESHYGFVLNFAKCASDFIFQVFVMLNTATTSQCSISTWEENWDGHKVHSPWWSLVASEALSYGINLKIFLRSMPLDPPKRLSAICRQTTVCCVHPPLCTPSPLLQFLDLPLKTFNYRIPFGW